MDIFKNTFHIYDYWHHINKEFNTQPNLRFHYFRWVESGKMVVTCQNKIITVNKGEMLYIPPERYAEIKILAPPDCYGRVARLRYFPGVDDIGYPSQSIKMTDKCVALLKNIPPSNGSVANSHYICAVYKFLDALQSQMTQYDDKRVPKLTKALDFMQKNNDYDIPMLARYCGMSERRFYAAFNEILGISPIKMKQKIQASKIEFLLKTTNLTIEEIAEEIGLKSSAHLRKIVKSRFSQSPKELRK